jgi:hypothetical protein
LNNKILDCYTRSHLEPPLLGIFIGSFNRSSLTFAQERDEYFKRKFKLGIDEKYNDLLSNFGRLNLIICEDCQDIACGLISIKKSISNGKVTWNSFAYQQHKNILEDLDCLKSLDFTFDANEYEKQLKLAQYRILTEF